MININRQIIITLLCLIIVCALLVTHPRPTFQYAGSVPELPQIESIEDHIITATKPRPVITATPVMKKQDFPAQQKPIQKTYKFTIKGRTFIVKVNNLPFNLFSVAFSDGSYRTVNPSNYTYQDHVKGKITSYSIANIANGNNVSLDNLYSNLIYIVMFTDHKVIDKLKSYGSVELNSLVNLIVKHPKKRFKITRPSKAVTNVFLYETPSLVRSYSANVGQPLNLNKMKIFRLSTTRPKYIGKVKVKGKAKSK